MNRTFRGVKDRRGTLLPLLLLTTVVVAGVVAVIALAEGSGTSSAVAVPLLALGLVAVPASGRQLAAIRRREIAVARLRGVTGGQLAVTLAVEPFLVLVLGALLGVVAGALVAAAAAGLWVGAESSLGLNVLPAVALIVVVGLGTVLVGMSGAIREPLADQVSVAERPRPASTAALFGSVLLLVAAVVATYRSSVADGQDPGWVVLAGPALVGLALGQVTVWLVRLGAVVGVRWTKESSMPAFLATRRLARTAEAASPIRLVVAATVIAAVSLTGAQQVGQWSEDTARMRVGAPYRILLEDADVDDALGLTRDLDPDGKWLMAAALVPDEGSVPARRGFVDTSRYEAVVGRFLAGTPAAEVSRHLDALGADAPFVGTGDMVAATVRGVSRRSSGSLRPRVILTYRNEDGESSTVPLRLRIGLDGKATTTDRAVPDCRGGCAATRLTLDRSAGDASLPWVLTGLELGGLDALDRDWRPVPVPTPQGVVAEEVTPVDDGLLVPPADRPLEAFPAGGGAAVPVLATDSAAWDGPPLLDSPGGEERSADVVARLPALPLVEADGVLADLPVAAAGAPPTVPAAEVMILAAADTPPDVLAAVAQSPGAESPRTLAEVEHSTSLETGATRALVYALMAGFCVLVALLVLASAVARQRVAFRREVAALRVLGVGLSQARRSGRWEIGALGVGAVTATIVGGVSGVALLLRNLALVDVPTHSVPLDVGVAALPLVASALAAVVLVVLVGGRGWSTRPEQTRPSLLREEI